MHSKYYAPSENLSVDSYSTFQEAGCFQTVHTQEIHTLRGKKIINYATYWLHIQFGHIHMMCVTTNMTATHTIVKILTKCEKTWT